MSRPLSHNGSVKEAGELGLCMYIQSKYIHKLLLNMVWLYEFQSPNLHYMYTLNNRALKTAEFMS